jgi:hypothetical protein
MVTSSCLLLLAGWQKASRQHWRVGRKGIYQLQLNRISEKSAFNSFVFVHQLCLGNEKIALKAKVYFQPARWRLPPYWISKYITFEPYGCVAVVV